MTKSLEPSQPTRSQSRRSLLSSPNWMVVAVVLLAVALLVGLRAASELAMMRECGSDPQMPIWGMLLLVKLGFWLFCAGLAAGLLIVLRRNRWGVIVGMVLLLVWTVMICRSSWEYQKGRLALADAADFSTSPARLRDLVRFTGLQAGYELDNRLAAHANTPPNTLRALYQRGQLGTQMVLASNPHTPQDILLKLANSQDRWVRRGLEQNPQLPEAARQKLESNSAEPAETQ